MSKPSSRGSTRGDFSRGSCARPTTLLHVKRCPREQRAGLAAIDRSELILAVNLYRHKRDTRKPR